MTTRHVPHDGPLDAKIVIVGEAPGADEERHGKPFIGYSGKLLRDALARQGIDSAKVLITNVCHYRPPNNKIESFVKIKEKKGLDDSVRVTVNAQVAEGMRELYELLATVRPTVIVPVGNIALWALTGRMRVAKRRGSVMSLTWDMARTKQLEQHKHLTASLDAIAAIQGTKVIPTFHPAYIARQFHHYPIFQTDLRRIRTDATFPELRLPERTYWINPADAELERLWSLLKSAELRSFDLECVGSRLYCLGFSSDPSWSLTLTADSSRNMEVIRDLLYDETPKVAQNGWFDVSYLAQFAGIEVQNYCHDTMGAVGVIYPEFPRGLDFITSIFTREPYYKDEGKNWNPHDAEDVQRFLTYNGKDCCVTLEAMQKLLASGLKDPAYRATYNRIMQRDSAVYIKMMVSGIRIDVGWMREKEHEYRKTSLELQQKLDELVLTQLATRFEQLATRTDAASLLLASEIEKNIKAWIKVKTDKKTGEQMGLGTLGGVLNVNSSPRIQWYLYRFRGMKIKLNTKTKKPTADEDALKELYGEVNDPFLLTIVTIREKRKAISSYLNIKHDPLPHNHGRTYFTFNPVKTKTGRSSSGMTILDYGVNMQTIPPELRDTIIADPGYYLLYLDLSQAEMRIVAYKGGVRRMIQCFESGEDVHKLTAMLTLGLPAEQIKEIPHRYLGKRQNHAFDYEMGAEKYYKIINRDAFETGVSITRADAKRYRTRHFSIYPELNTYWDIIREQVRKDRTLVNPLGRKRTFLGRIGDDLFREAFSHYAQSGVADILRTGMANVHEHLERGGLHRGDTTPAFNATGTRVALEIHDALLLQLPIGTESWLPSECAKLMEIPFDINGKEITIPVDAKIGETWGSMKKYALTPRS